MEPDNTEPAASPTVQPRQPARTAKPDFPPELDGENLPGALFGYDKVSVLKMLDRLRDRYWELLREISEREERIRDLEVELQRGREAQRLVGETLLAARQQAEAIREEARRSANSLLKTTRKHADEILAEAERDGRAKARELIDSASQAERDARARASELVESAEDERKKLLDEAGEAKAFVAQTQEQLSDFLLAAVKWYEQANPPEEDHPKPQAPPVSEKQS